MKLLDYTMKEVLKLLDISEGTIRNYEKKNLINCQRNNDNQYRHFTFRDLNRIITIRKYRNLGLSLDQINKLLNSNSFNNSKQLLEKQYNDTVLKAQKLLNNAEKIQKDIQKINKINANLSTFSIIKRPNYLFYEYNNIVKEDNSNIFYDDYATLLMKDELGNIINPKIGYVKLSNENIYANQKCLYTIAKINPNLKGCESFNIVMKPLIEYLNNHNYKITDNILGIKLLTLQENNSYYDYYEAYIPIIKNK